MPPATQALARSSFLLLWSAVLIMYPTSLAVISMTFSNYVLQPVFPNCIPPAAASRVLSMACLSEHPRLHVGGGWRGREDGSPQQLAPSHASGLRGWGLLHWGRLGRDLAPPPRGLPPQVLPTLPFLTSAPDVGQQFQCALGHTHPGRVHRREAAGPVPHHRRGLHPDLPRQGQRGCEQGWRETGSTVLTPGF